MLRLWGVMREEREVNQTILGLLLLNFGINRTLALKYCALLGMAPQLKLKDVPEELLILLDSWYFKYLRLATIITLKELKKIRVLFLIKLLRNGSYRGIRFTQGLPMRGQRTHSNSATVRRNFPLMIDEKMKKFFLQRKESLQRRSAHQKEKSKRS